MGREFPQKGKEILPTFGFHHNGAIWRLLNWLKVLTLSETDLNTNGMARVLLKEECAGCVEIVFAEPVDGRFAHGLEKTQMHHICAKKLRINRNKR